MNDPDNQSPPERYWNRAGEIGYAEAMFANGLVEEHVNRRLWGVARDIAEKLGTPANGTVLDLGCGDGAFAHRTLAGRYRRIDGFDLAPAAIERAQNNAPGPEFHFEIADLTSIDYDKLPRYDAVFMIGFLHHVKQATPAILAKVGRMTDRAIVLEPNGNHLVRKALELTPAYRAAGEDSFKTDELIEHFERVGFNTLVQRRMNLFPNFTPGFVYRLLAPLEPWVEANAVLNRLCTVNMMGFGKTAV